MVVVMLVLLIGAVPTCNSRISPEVVVKLKDKMVAESVVIKHSSLLAYVWNRGKGPGPRPVPPTFGPTRPVNERRMAPPGR